MIPFTCAYCGSSFEYAWRFGKKRKTCSPPCLKAWAAIRKRSYKSRHKDQARAHMLLNKAVASGEINRAPCEVCGSLNTDGHHSDYSKPLQVTWLCHIHHMERHATLTASQVAEIRASKESERKLAPAFGVSPATIGAIRRNRIWRHL